MMAAADGRNKGARRPSRGDDGTAMAGTWRLLEADARERAWFADLDAVQRLPAEPAAPPHRWRRVLRLRVEDRTYYLKRFARTQFKNRLRGLLTRPRATHDAHREAAMARALRAAGVDAARPVAVGRRGATSWYLCAAVRGVTLREWIAAGRATAALGDRVARMAGSLLARGLVLPDLSAEHVYVSAPPDRGGDHVLQLIDLHNGALRRAGRRDATRILGHFARSVRGLDVPRRQALAFAVRMLREAGMADAARGILARIEPLETHTRYEQPGRARAYRRRSRARHRAETALLTRVWPGRPGDLVVDVPSGTGRLAEVLENVLGARRVAVDRAAAMLFEDRSTPWRARADAADLPFADRGVAGVVCLRFLHHLPPRRAAAVVAELGRVADRYVVVSFFHPVSAHGLRRRVRELLTRRARARHALWPSRLRGWMIEHGFELHDLAAQRRWLRDFWIAAFVRSPATSRASRRAASSPNAGRVPPSCDAKPPPW